jgi:hypothetical protein
MSNGTAPQGIDAQHLEADMTEIKQGFASAKAIKHV